MPNSIQDQSAAPLAEQLAQIEYQNELAQIDRNWERDRQSYLVTDKHGQRHEPSEMGAIIGSTVIAGAGLSYTIAASSMQDPGAHVLSGLLIGVVGLIVGIVSYNRAKDFRRAHRRYRRRRTDINIAKFRGKRESTAGFLTNLRNIPTPSEYLKQLEQEQSSGQ